MDKATLDKVLERHAAWLRGEEGGERADLRGANLVGADLWDADLRGANLGDANLNGADLRYANLGGADLRDAELRGADLRDAELRDAELRDADLRYANLGGADLRDDDLRGANLRGAKLASARVYPVAADECVGVDIRIYSPGRDRIVAVRIDCEVIVQIGCQRHPIGHWLEEYRRIGEEAGYAEATILRYGRALQHLSVEFEHG